MKLIKFLLFATAISSIFEYFIFGFSGCWWSGMIRNTSWVCGADAIPEFISSAVMLLSLLTLYLVKVGEVLVEKESLKAHSENNTKEKLSA